MLRYQPLVHSDSAGNVFVIPKQVVSIRTHWIQSVTAKGSALLYPRLCLRHDNDTGKRTTAECPFCDSTINTSGVSYLAYNDFTSSIVQLPSVQARAIFNNVESVFDKFFKDDFSIPSGRSTFNAISVKAEPSVSAVGPRKVSITPLMVWENDNIVPDHQYTPLDLAEARAQAKNTMTLTFKNYGKLTDKNFKRHVRETLVESIGRMGNAYYTPDLNFLLKYAHITYKDKNILKFQDDTFNVIEGEYTTYLSFDKRHVDEFEFYPIE